MLIGCDLCTSSCPVLNDHRLLEQRAEPVGDGTGHGVGAAAGRGADQDAHRLAGPVLGLGGRGQQEGGGGNGARACRDAGARPAADRRLDRSHVPTFVELPA